MWGPGRAVSLALPRTDFTKEMRRDLHKRRDFCVERLFEMGFKVKPPLGAFYIFLNTSASGLDGTEFTQKFFEKEKVIVVPGQVFGDYYRDYVRLSYGSDLGNLEEAFLRMERFIRDKGN